MGNLRLIPFAIAVILGLSLFTDSLSVAAAQRGGDLCVAVSGGTVQNATNLDVVADGGTAISDSSGGQGNIAARADNNRNRNNNNNNNRNNRNRNRFIAGPLSDFEARLLQTDTASAGNAGVATASANGGSIAIGDVNSGGNSGNAIAIGDTVCPGAAAGGHAGGGGNVSGGGGRGGQIRALPSTGVGLAGTAGGGALLCALGALGFAGLSLGRRFDLRFARLGNR